MLMRLCQSCTLLFEQLAKHSISLCWLLIVLGNFVANNQTTDTLTISPGVEIRFDGNYRFDVFGSLIAVGTITDSITFTRNASTNWMSLNFSNSANDSSKVKYCIIEYGTESGYDPYRGVINCNNSSPTISNNTIQYNDNKGIYIDGSSAQPSIFGNIFQFNSNYSVYGNNSAAPEITSNIFGFDWYNQETLFLRNCFCLLFVIWNQFSYWMLADQKSISCTEMSKQFGEKNFVFKSIKITI